MKLQNLETLKKPKLPIPTQMYLTLSKSTYHKSLRVIKLTLKDIRQRTMEKEKQCCSFSEIEYITIVTGNVHQKIYVATRVTSEISHWKLKVLSCHKGTYQMYVSSYANKKTKGKENTEKK